MVHFLGRTNELHGINQSVIPEVHALRRVTVPGVRRVKNHVQNNGIKQAVVSMSLSGPRSASLNDAIQDVVNVSPRRKHTT